MLIVTPFAGFMDLAVTISRVDALMLTHVGRHLSLPEQTLLRGSLEELTYDQMATVSPYSKNYLMRDVGPKFWRLLSEILGCEVGKTSVREILSHQWQPGESIQSEPRSKTQWNWGNIPEVQVLQGYHQELTRLQQWVTEGSGLILVQGLTGVGKTTLVLALAHQLLDTFDEVIWRSLRHAPSLSILSRSFLALERHREDLEVLESWMNRLRTSRCLLVLDGFEALLQTKQPAGQYQPGYKDYGTLLQRLGDERHRSCVILTSSEPPPTAITQVLSLAGLDETAARSLLDQEHLGNSSAWPALIHRYQGHPAALKAVAKTIRDLFNGNVAEFLDQNTIVFGEVATLLSPAFQRLSPCEQEVLYWLATEATPVTFAALQQSLSPSISQAELLEYLVSLGQRSLLSPLTTGNQSHFTLPPLVRAYVTSQLLDQLRDRQPVPHILESHSLDLSAIQQPLLLSAWFQQEFPAGWLPLDTLFGPTIQSPRLRSALPLRGEGLIKRFKPLQVGRSEVALLMAIAPVGEHKTSIRTQVQPLQEQTTLPPQLKLSLLSQTGELLREVQAQEQDNFIQLPPFQGNRQERFALQISLADIQIAEEFII
jgi:DNA polymerase III delta prime subunit